MDSDEQQVAAGHGVADDRVADDRRPLGRRIVWALAAVTSGGVLGAAGVLGVGTTGVATSAGSIQAVSDAGSGRASSAVSSTVAGGVVDIDTTLGYLQATAAGTGMVLSSTGEILTHNHVVKGATAIRVTVVSTGRSYTASVVGTAPTQDVAVLQLAGATGLSTIPIGDSSTVSVGQAVTATGNAGGTGGQPTVVTGQVTAVAQTITAGDASSGEAQQLTGLIQTDAPIVAGDSGGPLAADGKVVGMDTAASASSRFGPATAPEGYAIPINTAVRIAAAIESGTASATVHIGTHGMLGIAVDPQADGSGAVVSGLLRGGSAAGAGLAAGDVITALDGAAVDSPTGLTTLLARTHSGQTVTVGWTDAYGQAHTARVTLTAAPAD